MSYGIKHPKELRYSYDDGVRLDSRYGEWVKLHEPCYYGSDGQKLTIEEYNNMK